MKKLIEIVAYYHKADPALAVSLKFVLAGILWILFSDSVVYLLGSEGVIWHIAHIQTLKGLFFVGITAGYFYYWTNRFVYSLEKKESEAARIFQSSPAAMGIVDASSLKFLEVNDELTALFGRTMQTLRAITLYDLSIDKNRFEEVPLRIRTGSRDLGEWQFDKDGHAISVEISAQFVRDKKAFLITFTDVTNVVRSQKDLQAIRASIENRMDDQIRNLTRMNEELAYRASQTEHVNAELISVNEQLQHVNKKIVRRAEDSHWQNDQMNEIMNSLSDVFWSFDLTGGSKSYISDTAQTLYEEPYENLLKAWFWLDFVHPDDAAVKEKSQQQLLEDGYSACTYRIMTRKGNIKMIFSRVKLFHDAKGIPLIIGCATDVSNIQQEFRKIMPSDPSVRHV